METTFALAKEHGLSALTLVAVIYLGVSTNSQFAELRNEMNREHAELRGEMNREHAELRGDMYREHTDIRGSVAEVSERLARVETKLGMDAPVR